MAAYAVLGAFAGLQLMPLAYGGNHVLTGQGRILALHMFQARFECDVAAYIRYRDGTVERRDLRMRQLPPRTTCDPIVYFNRAQNICRSREQHGIQDLRLSMQVKRVSDVTFTRVVDADQFCESGHEYRVLSRNKWISFD